MLIGVAIVTLVPEAAAEVRSRRAAAELLRPRDPARLVDVSSRSGTEPVDP